MSVENDVQALKEEFKQFKQETLGELHQLQRQASSRRGPEGPKGPRGDAGERGPAGTVSREEVKAHVAELYPEIAKEVARRVPLDFVEKSVRDVWRKFIAAL